MWRMSVEAPEDLLDKIGQASGSYELADLRSLMPELSTEELAVAGHAVALSNWHQVLHLTTSAPASKICICSTSRKTPSRFASAEHPKSSHHHHFLSACEDAVHVGLSLGLSDSIMPTCCSVLCCRAMCSVVNAGARQFPLRLAENGSAPPILPTESIPEQILWSVTTLLPALHPQLSLSASH